MNSPARPPIAAGWLVTVVAGLAAAIVAATTPAQARKATPVAPMRKHLDRRYHHDRTYPDRGVTLSSLPPERFEEQLDGRHYYFADGVWYRPRGDRFIVVAPPSGLYVPSLPPYYTTLWVGAVPYYYANDVFYLYRGQARGFEVVPPPPDARAGRASPAPTPPPVEGAQLFVYPDRGQSSARRTRDKLQCQQWASRQTGFKPAAAGDTQRSASSKPRRAYDRAIEACLEGRGYTVR